MQNDFIMKLFLGQIKSIQERLFEIISEERWSNDSRDAP